MNNTDSKLKEIKKQLNNSMKQQGLKMRGLFNLFDTDGDGMVNLREIQNGIGQIMVVN